MREIGEIELSIQGGTEEIEALGEAGKVEESMEKLQAVDALKGLKAEKERDLQTLNETAGASGHQKLRVCETCVSAPSPGCDGVEADSTCRVQCCRYWIVTNV
jgi:RNA-binding protein Luc7-like 2